MRTPFGALLATLVLTATAACGASGGEAADDPTTTTEAEQTTTTTEVEETTTTEPEIDGVDLDEWATGFCGGFEGWIADIQASSAEVSSSEPPDLATAKETIVGLFADAASHTDGLITALEDGGAPAIEDGEALVDDLIGKFEDFNAAIASARGEAEALATDDPVAFDADVTALVGTFQDEVTKVGESFAELDQDYPDPELSAALSEACTSF